MGFDTETYWNTIILVIIKHTSIARRLEKSNFTGTGATVTKQAVQISWSDWVILLMRSGIWEPITEYFLHRS